MPDGNISDQPLLILCLPTQTVLPGAEVLLSSSCEAKQIGSLNAAATALAENGEARLAILCPEPEAWIALGLEAGTAPSDAVRSWREEVRPLLAMKRARRRHTTLVFDSILASSPAFCAEVLNLPAPDGAIAMRPAMDPVLLMIARDALRRDPSALTAAEELTASALSTSASEPASRIEADMAFSAYREKLDRLTATETALNNAEIEKAAARSLAAASETALAGSEKQLETFRDEVSLLKEQIKLDAEAASLTRASASEDVTHTKSIEGALEKSQALVKTLTKEVSLLRNQVALDTTASHDAQSEFSKEQTKSKSSELALAKSRAILGQTENEVALLREQIRLDRTCIENLQSTVDAERAKNTAQVASANAMKAALEAKLKEAEQAAPKARQKAEDELGQMIQQLREQIRHMSQGLESYHGQVENLEAERSDLIGKVGQLHRGQEDLEGYYDQARKLTDQVASMSDELTSLRGLLEERDTHLSELQNEIAKIHRSRSYRLMTPLRKIRKAID